MGLNIVQYATKFQKMEVVKFNFELLGTIPVYLFSFGLFTRPGTLRCPDLNGDQQRGKFGVCEGVRYAGPTYTEHENWLGRSLEQL